MDVIINESYQQFLDLLLNIDDEEIASITSYINQYSDNIYEIYKPLYKSYLYHICLHGEDKKELIKQLTYIKYQYMTLESIVIIDENKYSMKTSYALTIDGYIQEVLETLGLEEDYRYEIYNALKGRRYMQQYHYIYEIEYYDFFFICLKNRIINVYIGETKDVPISYRNN